MALAVFAVAAGCVKSSPPACITVDTTCKPAYSPTFDNVYSFTLTNSCGSQAVSCHSSAGHQAGLSFGDEATAYAGLLDNSTIDPSRKRVVPGDASCSLMIVRTDSPGADYQMPIGDALDAAERCSLIQWVEAGAPGPGSGSAR